MVLYVIVFLGVLVTCEGRQGEGEKGRQGFIFWSRFGSGMLGFYILEDIVFCSNII